MSLSSLLCATNVLRTGPGSQLGWPPNHTPTARITTTTGTQTYHRHRLRRPYMRLFRVAGTPPATALPAYRTGVNPVTRGGTGAATGPSRPPRPGRPRRPAPPPAR